jgi:hypothetical protein
MTLSKTTSVLTEISIFFNTVYSVCYTELSRFSVIMRNSVVTELLKFRGIPQKFYLPYLPITSSKRHMYCTSDCTETTVFVCYSNLTFIKSFVYGSVPGSDPEYLIFGSSIDFEGFLWSYFYYVMIKLIEQF